MSEPTLLPAFNAIEEALEGFHALMGAPESHGLLCGLLCLGQETPDTRCIDVILGNEANEQTATATAFIRKLFDISYQQLDTFGFEFELTLPNEEETLLYRTESLALWCQGFLMGLMLGREQKEPNYTQEINEAIEDITYISKLSPEDITNSEEDEAAYTELSEYVRLVVMMIFTEWNTAKKTIYH